MKTFTRILSAAALSTLAFSAHAISEQSSPNEYTTPRAPKTAPGFHVVLNGGMTYGGDTIVTAVYTDGSTTDIKGGAMVQFGMGGLYQFESKPLAVLLSANYHYHTAAGGNGDITFSRVPIEILGYYTGKERFRIGGGMRIVNSPELVASVNGVTNSITFDNTTGIVGEIGYQLSQHGWMNVRFVSEKYTAKSIIWNSGAVTNLVGVAPVSGSHLGINFNYEF